MAKVAVAEVSGVDARLAAAFEVLAESPDGVARMRELVLSLAVSGHLVPQDPMEEPAIAFLRRIGVAASVSLPGNEAIPQGWASCTMGDLLQELQPGWSPSCLSRGRVGDEYGVLKVSACSWGQFLPEENKSLPPGLEIPLGIEVRRGDWLISRANTVELVARSVVVKSCPPRLLLSDKIIRLVTKPGVVIDFVNLANLSPRSRRYYEAEASGTSASMRNVSQAVIQALPICVPPVAEQRRIVARFEELMACIDQFEAARNQREAARIAARDACLATLCAATNPTEVAAAWSTLAARFDSLFTASADVEPLRLAIIHLAVRGALVGRSSQGESGDACPDHALGWPFAGAGGVLPLGWCWARLGEVADARLGKMLDKAKNRGASRPYLRNTNVHWFRFELGSIKQIPLGDGEFEDLRLTSGDVLICEGGHGIGRSAVWMGQIDGVVFQKALHRVRPTDRLDSWFLTFCLRVLEATGVLASYYTGAGIPHFTGKALDRLLIALPPCDEQRRIVERATELLMVCDQLELALVSTDASAQAVSEALVSCEASA